MLKLFSLIYLILIFSNSVFAHAGSHGNNDCLVTVGDSELRLNGYQFKGKNPDRHYCRHFPHLGQTIIKIDSIATDLTDKAIELQVLKRHSWLGLILNNENAFSVIKQLPMQYFSRQVVSISSDINAIDVYAINLKLYSADSTTSEQRFLFLVGFPFVQIMVGIAVVLLLFIAFIFFRQLWSKRQQH